MPDVFDIGSIAELETPHYALRTLETIRTLEFDKVQGSQRMAMNREQRRYLQKQGEVDAEGNAVQQPRENREVARGPRVGPRQYLSEVRSELTRVTWPTRDELVKFTTIVIITVLFLTGFIALLDYGFGEAVLELLRQGKS